MAERLPILYYAKSINFLNGASFNVDLGTDFIGTGDITVSFWLKPTARLGINAYVLDNSKFRIFYASTTRTLNTRSDGTTSATSLNISANEWQHITVTRTSAGVVNYYLKGVAFGTANLASGTPAAGTTNLLIGNSNANSQALIGKINTLRIFNRILTNDEITNLCFKRNLPSDSDTSLLAGYDFLDNANDISSNARNGIVTGATFVTDTPKQTRNIATSRTVSTNRLLVRDMGTALRFGTASANVTTNTNVMPTFSTTSYTISGWIKAPLVTSNVAADQQTIFGSGASLPYWSFVLRNSYYLFRYQDSGEDRQTTSPQIPNQFIFVTCVLDKTNSRNYLYINGALMSSVAITSNLDLLSETLKIGFITGQTYFNGVIDEVRLWSTALTAQEISDLYFKNIVPRSSLAGQWLFDEASGTTANDTSGNGNTGTITGATYTTDTRLQARDTI